MQQTNKLETLKDCVKTAEDANREKTITDEIRKADKKTINITHNVM